MNRLIDLGQVDGHSEYKNIILPRPRTFESLTPLRLAVTIESIHSSDYHGR